jgi:hypothetical protein
MEIDVASNRGLTIIAEVCKWNVCAGDSTSIREILGNVNLGGRAAPKTITDREGERGRGGEGRSGAPIAGYRPPIKKGEEEMRDGGI